MKLVVFTYERNLGIPHQVMYVDAPLIKKQGIKKTVEQIKEFNPDLIIEREFNDGIAVYSEVYNYLPGIPKAYWCIDAHITLADHINYSKQFDYVFLAQSWFFPLFDHQVSGKLFYLPLCHTQTLPEYQRWLTEPEEERDIELSFVGNINSLHVDRKRMVMDLKEQMGDSFLAVQASYDKMLKILARSKMTFNCSLNNDLNFRVWEALATNTPIMTDLVDDIGAISNLSAYLHVIYPKRDDDRLEKPITSTPLQSSDFIMQGHTLTHRYEQMLWMIQANKQRTF